MLVNNAGILHEDWSLTAARDTLHVNFEGVVATTEAILPLLEEREWRAEDLVPNTALHTEMVAKLQEHVGDEGEVS